MTGIYSTDDRLSLIRAVNITNGVVDGFNIRTETPICIPQQKLIKETYTKDEVSKYNKRITRGAYRGKTQLERNVWKITPFKNLIELNDIPSKRRYYDTQITGD